MTPSTADRVQIACEFGRVHLGSAHPSHQKLEQRLDVSPEALRLVMGGDGCCIAESLIYPLRESVVERILAAEVVRGGSLVAADLAPPDQAAGLYVAVVAARPGAGASAISGFLRHVDDLLARGPGVTHVFARPATETGRGLLDRFDMQPIGGPSEIWFTDRLDSVSLRRR